MLRFTHVPSAPWLMAVFVFLLGLGHACAPATFGDLVAHAAEAAHQHETEHHADGSQISCGVVDATNTASFPVDIEAAETNADVAAGSRLIRRIGLAGRGSIQPATGPPLFLLHGSLLI